MYVLFFASYEQLRKRERTFQTFNGVVDRISTLKKKKKKNRNPPRPGGGRLLKYDLDRDVPLRLQK